MTLYREPFDYKCLKYRHSLSSRCDHMTSFALFRLARDHQRNGFEIDFHNDIHAFNFQPMHALPFSNGVVFIRACEPEN